MHETKTGALFFKSKNRKEIYELTSNTRQQSTLAALGWGKKRVQEIWQTVSTGYVELL